MHKILLTFLLLSLPLLLPAPARGQASDSTLWVPDGPVYTVAQSGNTLYLGGNFTHVQPRTGGGGVVNATDGQLVHNPRIDGTVLASAPDGNGGWYIGGEFSRVQGWSQPWLAHLRADGSLDKAWNPRLSGRVLALVLTGGKLYVGGEFTMVDGQPRRSLASLDAATGEVTGWDPGANSAVYSLAAVGSVIYAGGGFTSIGGQARNFVAALDAVSGQPSAWNPMPSQAIYALAVSGNVVYLGGIFNAVGGQYRQNLAAVDATTGQVTAWNPGVDRGVGTLVVAGSTVYVGGSFSTAGGQSRTNVAAIDAATGQATAWNPEVSINKVGISAIAVSGNTVYLGGNFTSIGTGVTNNVAAVDATTGRPTSWNPRTPVSGLLDMGATTISISGGNLFVGGDFTSIGGQARRNLAALDVVTGRPTAWNPGVDSLVTAVAVAGGRVYVAGGFVAIGGQSRRGLAALDTATGTTTAWNPGFQGYVSNMVAAGGTVYIGGGFSWTGEPVRKHLVALNAATGQLTSWNPNPNDAVEAIAVAGSTVYAGGSFLSIGGQARQYVAALDASTGLATAWNPHAKDRVSALALAGNTVYAGGAFTHIAGQSRSYLAAVDVTTGQATPWNPVLNNPVTELAAMNGTVYAGGHFTAVNGQGRIFLAAIDAASGQPTGWNPNLNAIPLVLSSYDGRLHVGGQFATNGGREPRGLLVFGSKKTPGFNLIRGNIYEDADGDCVKDANERGIPGRVVVAQPGNYFGTADSLGNYALSVDSGSYVVQQIIPASRLPVTRQLCPTGPAWYPVRFANYNNTVTGKDFANQTQLHTALSVSVSSWGRRRCFRSTTVVTYGNSGTGPAQGVKVYVKLPPHVVPVTASVPYRLDRDKNLVFDVGTLDADANGIIYLTDSVVCNNPSIRGLTQCTKVWITPDNPRPQSPEWDGSDIALKGACAGNGTVRLVLSNAGGAAMADSSAFRVYANAELALSRRYKLAQGDSLVLQVPANGRTLRLEADQRPAHPRKRQSSCTVEACGTDAGGQVSQGFVNLFPQDDEEPEVAIQCLPITDSFDPNDKAVSPRGVTDEHYTPTRSRLDYLIRFQNTGTDVAYKVVVVDTLSADLDVSTLQLGSVSHPCKVQVSGKGRPVLTFTFNNIMLPDSNANEPDSHGFIQFSVKPRAGLPEKTRIENFADIFFDYNEPVRTNTVFNRIYDVPPVVTEAARLDPAVICYRAPAAPSAGAARSVCTQDTVHLQATSPAFGKGNWRRISGGGALRETNNPASVVTGLAFGDNVFEWCVAADACGTDSLRARVTITRRQQPVTPTITRAGTDSLVCSPAGGNYAWYFDGAPLGLTTRTIRAAREGRYAVWTTDAAGCPSALSAPFAYVLTAVQPGAASRVELYPNPTTGRVAVVLPAGLGPQVHVTVYDALGRLVLSRRVLRPGAGDHREAFDLSACRPGVLLFRLQTPGGVVTRRVVRSSR
jgi:predicted small secreted protein